MLNIVQPKIVYSHYKTQALNDLSYYHKTGGGKLSCDVFKRTQTLNDKQELNYEELKNADIDDIKIILDKYKDEEGNYLGVEGLNEDSIEDFYIKECHGNSASFALKAKLFKEKERIILGDDYSPKVPADKFSIDNKGIWYTTDIINFEDTTIKLDNPAKLRLNLYDKCLNLSSADEEVLLKLIETYCKETQERCNDYPKSQEDKKELIEKITNTLSSIEDNQILNSKLLSRKLSALAKRIDSIENGNVEKLDKPEEFPYKIALDSEPIYKVSYEGSNTINYFNENGQWVISKQLDSNGNVARYETPQIDSMSSDCAGAKNANQSFQSRYSFVAYNADGEKVAQRLNKGGNVVIYENNEEKFSYAPLPDSAEYLKMYFENRLSLDESSTTVTPPVSNNIKTELFSLLNEENNNPISNYFSSSSTTPTLLEFKDYLNSLDENDKYYNLIKECIKTGGGKLILTFGKGKDNKHYFAINNVKPDLNNGRNHLSLIKAIPNKNAYNGKCSETMLQYIAGDALVGQDFHCLKLTIDKETDEIDCKNFHPCSTCAQNTALYGYNFKPLD